MLVTPKKGTACLTLTLVVDATVMVPSKDHCPRGSVSRRRFRIARKPAGIRWGCNGAAMSNGVPRQRSQTCEFYFSTRANSPVDAFTATRSLAVCRV